MADPMLVDLDDINSYLPTDKWEMEAIDTTLVLHEQSQVLAKLSTVYDVSGWTSKSNTPLLVRSVISMFVAGTAFNRQFADDSTDEGDYGGWLLERANMVLEAILDGRMSIADEEPEVDRMQPTVYDAKDPKFSIGMTF